MNFSNKFDQKLQDKDISEKQLLKLLKRVWPVSVAHIVKLTNGFSHLNYKFIDAAGESFVLRLSDKLEQHFNTEFSILSFLESKLAVPKVLYAELLAPELEMHAMIMEYIDGIDLCDVEDVFTNRERDQVAEQLGDYLSRLHGIKLSQAGFLNENLKVYEPFKESCFEDFYQFITKALTHPLVKTRLETLHIETINHFLEANASTWDQIKDDPCLVHSDFNSKNIRVKKTASGDWELKAVLDWEYCFSGHGFVDLGNFFRFEGEQPDYESTFLKAYFRGMQIPDTWRSQAKFFDLVSLLQFLMRQQESPQTFKTCRQLLEQYN